METIEIQLSKKKMFILLIASSVFVLLGVLFLNNPVLFENRRFSHGVIFIVGAVTVLFFGICAGFYMKKLFSKQVGLTIHTDGFIDNSSGVSAGKIFWCDVEAITEYNVMSQKFVTIHIKDPEKYLEAQENIFKRKIMVQNYKMSGTPISISPSTLKISFEELYDLLQERFKTYKQTL